MNSTDKEVQLYQAIHEFQIDHWVETTPTGYRIRTASGLKLLQVLGLAGILMFVMYLKASGPRGEAPDWFKWVVLGAFLLALLAVVMTVYRRTHVDLSTRKASVQILGYPVFQRPLSDFKGFSFDPGMVVNGVDPGGVLYMHFQDGGKLRVVQLRDPNDLENLQRFILQTIRSQS